MIRNVLLLGVKCPIGESIAIKLSQFGVHLTKSDANQLKSNLNCDQKFDAIINNVFASLNVHQWLNNECTTYEELNHLSKCRWLHISPFPMKPGETLIPEALPWSSFAYRLSANTTALKHYCRSEDVVAEAVAKLLMSDKNVSDHESRMTTVESVLSNDLLKSRNKLLKGSFHLISNSKYIDYKMLESQKLMSL